MKGVLGFIGLAMVATVAYAQNSPLTVNVARDCNEHVPTFLVTVKNTNTNVSTPPLRLDYVKFPFGQRIPTDLALIYRGRDWVPCSPVGEMVYCRFNSTELRSSAALLFVVRLQLDVTPVARTGLSVTFYSGNGTLYAASKSIAFTQDHVKDCAPSAPVVQQSAVVRYHAPICERAAQLNGIATHTFRLNYSATVSGTGGGANGTTANGTVAAALTEHRLRRFIVAPANVTAVASYFNRTSVYLSPAPGVPPLPCFPVWDAGVFVCTAPRIVFAATVQQLDVVIKIAGGAGGGSNALPPAATNSSGGGGTATNPTSGTPPNGGPPATIPTAEWTVRLSTTYTQVATAAFVVRDNNPACAVTVQVTTPVRVCDDPVPTYKLAMVHSSGAYDNTVVGDLVVTPNTFALTSKIKTDARTNNGGPITRGGANTTSQMDDADFVWASVGYDGPREPCWRFNGSFHCPVRYLIQPFVSKAWIFLRFGIATSQGHRPLAILAHPSNLPPYMKSEPRSFEVTSLPSPDDKQCGGQNVETFAATATVRHFGPVCEPGHNVTAWRFGSYSNLPSADVPSIFNNVSYGVTLIVVRFNQPILRVYRAVGNWVNTSTSSTWWRTGNTTVSPRNHSTLWLHFDLYSVPCFSPEPTRALCLPQRQLKLGSPSRPTLFRVMMDRTDAMPDLEMTVTTSWYMHGSAKTVVQVGSLTDGNCTQVRRPVETNVSVVPSVERLCPALGLIGLGALCPIASHGAICKVGARCSNGYVGTPSGHLECVYGSWRNNSATGCRLDPSAAGTACATPYMQTGYVTKCPTGTASGKRCSATCAADHAGEAVGAVTCVNGRWENTFSGCSALCTLPATVCSQVTGRPLPQYQLDVVTRFTTWDNVTACKLPSANAFDVISLKCAEGYAFESGSALPAKCAGGVLVGGWVTTPPKCVKREAADLEANCGCGGKPTTTSVRGGKIRTTALATPAGEWACTSVDRTYTCVCKCKGP